MRFFLYRVLDTDDEGDPLDFGTVKAANQEMAVKHVKKHLRKIGILTNVEFKVYPIVDRLTSGVMKSWGNHKDITRHFLDD